MRLYILRHATAEEAASSGDDGARKLTDRSKEKMRGAAAGLRAMGLKFDVILTSPLVRAVQTAEIFAEALGYSPEKIRVVDALKSTGNPAEGVKELARLRAKEAACFGHAPHLDQMIAQMAVARGVFTQLKKAGVACLEREASGRWDLLWLVTPKVLRQLAE